MRKKIQYYNDQEIDISASTFIFALPSVINSAQSIISMNVIGGNGLEANGAITYMNFSMPLNFLDLWKRPDPNTLEV